MPVHTPQGSVWPLYHLGRAGLSDWRRVSVHRHDQAMPRGG
jgi:hypothetical protein